ncbi:MAG: hypothetical protein WC825_00135 [Gallionellaceae bacterium]
MPRIARCIEGWATPAGFVGWVERSDTQQNNINTVGGSPTASHFLLLRQKESNPRKGDPGLPPTSWVPCVARLVRRLRNSRYALRQSSPKSPDQPALLGGAQGKESESQNQMVGSKPPTSYDDETQGKSNSLPYWSKQILIAKRDKLPRVNHSIPSKNFRRRNRLVQKETQEHWLDIWLPRISHFSQFGLFVVTLGSLYFVVLPIYQKSILDEAIARKEIELKESQKLVAKSYEKLRSYTVNQFINMAGLKCATNLLAMDFDKQPREAVTKSQQTVLNRDASNCLKEEAIAYKELEQLSADDQVTFSVGLGNIAEKIEQERIIALKRYRDLPNKAKQNTSLLKPPKYFSRSYIERLEKLNKATHLLSEAKLAKLRFDAGVHAAQLDEESEYMDFARTQLTGLLTLAWRNSR